METDERMSESDSNQHTIPAWRAWVVQWDMSHNSIPLAFFAFTAMWQTAARCFPMIHIPAAIGYVFYIVSWVILAMSAVLTVLRIFVYPRSIVGDFKHPRLMNFFFMPVIIGALLILTTPPSLRSVTLFRTAFYTLSTYQLLLTLYFFGEWLLGSHPTIFIHPLVFMQTIGFFLLANIGATAHLSEHAWAMLSIGTLLWLLVFFTNFQHVALALDKKRERPSPTFFLFIAPPAQAAIALLVLEAAKQASAENLPTDRLVDVMRVGQWPISAKNFLYIDLFMYMLIFRLFPTFWTVKFSVSWWAYIFPLSAAASATILRCHSQPNSTLWRVLAALFAILACIAMIVVLTFTITSIWRGQTPRNENCLAAYKRHYIDRPMDEESGSASRDTDDIELGYR